MNRKQRRAEAKGAPQRGSNPALCEADALRAAVHLHQTGKLADADALYRRILAANPRHADAMHLRGVLAYQASDAASAATLIGGAIKLKNSTPAYHANFALALLQLGRPEEALRSSEVALRLKPDYVEAHFHRAAALTALQRPSEALAACDAALQLKPAFAEAYNNRGNLLTSLGRIDEALAAYEAAIRVRTNFADAHYNRGNALMELDRAEDALAAYDTAINLRPNVAEPYFCKARLLAQRGRLEEAASVYDKALSLSPDTVEAYNERGNVLMDLGRVEEALESFEAALRRRPDAVETLNNRGSALFQLHQLDAALASFDAALAIKPDVAEAHANRANVLKEMGLMQAALQAFDKAIAVKPEAANLHIMRQLLQPRIGESCESLAEWRDRFRDGLRTLEALPSDARDWLAASFTSFFLAYQNGSDRPLLEALSRLYRSRIPALNSRAPHVDEWQFPTDRRVRVGFCSQFLTSHTIGKLYQGFLRGLDRTRFEVIVIHAATTKHDAFSNSLDRVCNRVVRLGGSLEQKQKQMAALALDALFFPDIGMSPETYFLAHMRAAPVQLVSYGHPVTSGIETLDYFIGGDLPLEPVEAETEYSEHLVRSARLPFHYAETITPPVAATRAAFGLPETGTLYGCPQSLFKIHPDFDAVLAAIATSDPSGRIVLIEGPAKPWSRLLRKRWEGSAPILNERVLFLPRMPTEQFMALVGTLDVLLDPPHFGSGNTLFESMAYGKPIVTWPGRYARGRFVAAAYHQMALGETAPIATSLEHYAEIAVQWGLSREARLAFENRAKEAARAHLYADGSAVQALESFLIEALQEASHGRKLPSGWRVSPGRAEKLDGGVIR